MSTWEKASWRNDGALFLDTTEGRFFVLRHGEGRKYWGVQHPDGTYTHTALTQAEAKTQAEAWKRDPTLVQLPAVEQDALPTPAPESAEQLAEELAAADVVAAFLANAPAFKIAGRGYSYTSPGETQKAALSRLQLLIELRAAVEAELLAQVTAARTNTGSQWYSNAATWEVVGQALGVSKQAAMSKYASKIN